MPEEGEHQNLRERRPRPNSDRKPERRKLHHWTGQYNTDIQLREGWAEGDEESEALPQWGWMKGLIEGDYVPKPRPETHYTKYISLSLLTTFLMVTMGALGKFSLRYAAHPHQLGVFKTGLILLFGLVQRPKMSLLSEIGMTKWDFTKRAWTQGCLAVSMNFVARTLPLSIVATINALNPLVNAILAALCLGETMNPALDFPVLLTAGLGTFVCSRPPILTGVESSRIYTTTHYVAISLAVCQLFVRGYLMITGRALRKKGAQTEHFTALMLFDTSCQVSALTVQSFLFKTTHKVFSCPDWRLLALLVAVALLQQLRPYLMSSGSSNLPVIISSLLGTTNVLFSIFYSLYLFNDQSIDQFYICGTCLVITACLVKLNLTKTEEGKPGKKKGGKSSDSEGNNGGDSGGNGERGGGRGGKHGGEGGRGGKNGSEGGRGGKGGGEGGRGGKSGGEGGRGGKHGGEGGRGGKHGGEGGRGGKHGGEGGRKGRLGGLKEQ
ncbi:hypothetical protein ACHWQZ_G015030 [Mnemiopsis leidyi]